MLAQSHFAQRAAHECVRRVWGDDSPQVEPSSVLVVDDDESMRMCFKHLFRMPSLSRHQVEMADSANQAMAMIATRCYDVVLVDFRLDNGTAIDLVKTWREYNYEIPFICISGYPHAEGEMRAIGASGFILKTELTPAKIAQELRRALEGFWTAKARSPRA